MALSLFHPLVAEWFRERFSQPTDVQLASWPAIVSGADTLIAAPTGSGKTLAAFLACIDDLFKQALARNLEERTQVLYVSPLKALSNDIQKNLQQPLAEIGERAISAGMLIPEVRVEVRTGDTPAWNRRRMLLRPPHILVTTPESLFLLLTAEKSREILRDVRTLIVDEIHAVASNKRGSHLALSLERLDALAVTKPVRIGLSATQEPIREIAAFLVGGREKACRVIDMGHRRPMDLGIEVPKDELGSVATNAIWSDIYDRLADLARAHRTTLIFVNTRRLAERIAHHLAERVGEDQVAAHHGSLSRRLRLSAEDRLKCGDIRVIVATASLELGIDIGSVELACQVGSPRAIAIALQRLGRSGHWVGALPKGRLFPTTRDDLIECAALVKAIREGILDRLAIPPEPLDILAQQIVAAAATHEWQEDALFEMCRRAYPYRRLQRQDFDDVVQMLSEGFATSQGRRGALIHHDGIQHRLKGRRGARLAALTSGGAIPDTANYAVIAEPEGLVVGSVDEDFAVESLAGDIMLLGNASWRIRGIETGTVRVEDAHGAPPTIPFWRGEAPSRTSELSAQVARVRQELARFLEHGSDPASLDSGVIWLQEECALDRRGAEQAMGYVKEGREILGTVPTQETIVAERFFDESGGMQLVLHAPFGGRVNRAWGLALRKRFCAAFDLELQAAATDEGLVISLGERHSFPLASVFDFLKAASVQEVLVQAILASPMFMTRWRWNASRALALLRFSHGRRVAPQIQRMRAEDLLSAVFPAATACQDNPHGEMHLPDHPLVRETLRDCLTEALDLDGLIRILQRMERGEIRCVAVETPMPSPFGHEILNANPYAFLDDAPLEERRTRAVQMRRSLPSDLSARLGGLDPAAIAQVVQEASPVVRDPDELHDALLTLMWVPADETEENWAAHLPTLLETGRARVLSVPDTAVGGAVSVWVATERMQYAEAALAPNDELPEQDEAISAIVRGWMETIGPTTAVELARRLRFAVPRVSAALLRLESSGQVLRGRFTPTHSSPLEGEGKGEGEEEWCDRRLLARVHRLTTAALRREIEPVTAAEFMRFLFQWQHVAEGSQLHGEAGLLEVIRQLSGFEAAGTAWERHLLSTRIVNYKPEMLDRLCLGGVVAWGRLTSPIAMLMNLTSAGPIGLFPREDVAWLLARDVAPPPLSSIGADLHRHLLQRGASFFMDLVRGTGHLAAEVEQGLWELVSAGLVTADGFDSLRALLDPRRRRAEGRERGRGPRHSIGRWSLFQPESFGIERLRVGSPEFVDRIARQLLQRYGIVFRDLIARESCALPWRDLLVQYRRLELRGEIRGGRFVAGFTGEQFGLPEAIEALRSARRQPEAGPQEISATDPLNLVGIVTPGDRVPSVAGSHVVFQGGVPIGMGGNAALLIPGESSSRFPCG